MPTVIYTGDPDKCKLLAMLECPVCGCSFELMDGRYLPSVLLNNSVKVCPAHTELSVDDELHIQEALQRALAHPRGRVEQDKQMLKRSVLLEAISYKLEKV